MPASQPSARRQRFQLGGSIFSSFRVCRHSGFAVIPGLPSFRVFRHSNFSPSFRRKPESTRCAFPVIRVFPVIPAQAGIYALRFVRHSGFSPSFRRKPESTRGDLPRHSRASRNLRAAICPVIPAPAGIYALRWPPVFAGMTAPYLNPLNRTTAPAAAQSPHPASPGKIHQNSAAFAVDKR